MATYKKVSVNFSQSENNGFKVNLKISGYKTQVSINGGGV